MKEKEILLIAEAVQNEKDVSEDDVFGALEAALAAAIRKSQADTIEVRVSIDRKTGEYRAFRRWHVLDDEDPAFFSPDCQILVSTARGRDENLNVDDYIEEEIDKVAFGRISAHAAKQVIAQKLREAERSRIASLYRPLIDTVVMGIAKREEHSGLYVELIDGIEGFIPRDEMIPREAIRAGQRIRAHLREVREEMRGPQLILSRTSPELLINMFKIEVPEVGQGLIEIMGAARDPGLRSKIAVRSNDPSLDPVGACVGMRGSRVQSVSNELAEEKVDIIPWDEDPAKFVINAMSPAPVTSIVVDEEKHYIDVAVEEDKLSLAIGRGGQNVRLASQLLGWHINIITTEQAEEKRQEETDALTKMFCKGLDVDQEIANILVQEGFATIEEVAYVPVKELLEVEEFDEKMVDEIRTRANEALLKQAIMSNADDDGKSANDLSKIDGMDEMTLQKLHANGIQTVQDLADQAVDDLLEIGGIGREKAAELIMTARQPMFDDGNESEADEGEDSDDEPEQDVPDDVSQEPKAVDAGAELKE